MTTVLGGLLLAAVVFVICLVLVRKAAAQEASTPVEGRHRADTPEASLDGAEPVTVGAHVKTTPEV